MATFLMAPENHVSIPLGITIGLLASFIQSLGLTIQRKSHVLNQLLPESQQRVEHRRPLWLLGFAVFISSNIIGSLVQIASLPVVILAPLGAVSLLWNAFFARFLLGDVFSPWMILGTLLIAGGAVLIAIFGIVPEPASRSLDELLALFARRNFVLYFSSLAFFVVVSLAITHIVEYRLAKSSPLPLSPVSPAVQLLEPVTERTALLDRKSIAGLAISPAPASKTWLLVAISYASFSGILSGMCLLFAKSGVELLLLTLRGNNQFWRWQAWMLVLGLVGFALLQLWYLHKALILADPTLVCPSAFCFYNLSSIFNGLVYFDQLALITPLHLFLVVLGIVILLGGVWVVSIQSGDGTVTTTFVEQTLDVPIADDEDQLESDWGFRSEPVLQTISSSPTGSALGLDFGPEGEMPTSPMSTVTCPLPNSSTSARKPRLSGHGRHPTYSESHSYLRRGTSYSALSPPLNATVASLAGAGFQIGLSPLSPGFSIVPVDRRRSNLPSDETRVRPGGDLERRRTVSEGDWRTFASSSRNNTVSEDPEPQRDHGRRWRWLRRLTSKKSST
ncbi:hypothetical protein C8J56DRAFT_918981 [Mycena floridula]|nr:hypothetical protein C8J56DRAFT_918981 [Mycena floridula]